MKAGDGLKNNKGNMLHNPFLSSGADTGSATTSSFIVVLISCLFLIVMLMPTVLSARNTASEKSVNVSAQGSAPVSQGIIQAKQTALMLAKRQAAEKAVGMSIEIKNTPDKREIIEKAMAGLKYSVVSEQVSGGMYTVIIHAVVNVSAKRKGTIQPSTLQFTATASKKPLIEKTPYGKINWTDGYIIAYGKGKITEGPSKSISNAVARRAALLDAHARALEIIERVNLNGDTTVKGFISKNARLFYRLKGLIARIKPFEQSKKNGFYRLKIKVPFYSVKGLEVIFINTYVKTRTHNAPVSAAGKHIVIDARGTGLKPAMFIKIKNRAGKDIYSAGNVNKSVLKNRGMVKYVTSSDIKPDDINIKAVKASGKRNGNIIISPSDAKKIEQAPGNKGIMSGGNVIIITDSPVGGTEGSLLLRFALL